MMNLAYYQIYSVLKGAVKHRILVVNGEWAAHMGPARDVVIERPDEAICGRPFDIVGHGWARLSANELLLRARALEKKRQYGLFYNCEDFIEELLGNEPNSPQRNFWIGAILCGAIVAIAAKR